MARRKKTNEENHIKINPQLVVPRQEAVHKIQVQIDKGIAIRNKTIRSKDEIEDGYREKDRWVDYTKQLLLILFDVDSIEEEFSDHVSVPWFIGQPFSQEVENFGTTMETYINRLVSIMEKLELIPEKLEQNKTEISGNHYKKTQVSSRDVFIVHGHDDAAKETMARYLEKLDLNPVILHEKASGGRTIIEKIEAHSNVGFAVVLLTPDDEGHRIDHPGEIKPRARQNVILELGYFMALLGRGKVAALIKSDVKKGDIELPSDFQGVLYIPMDSHGGWKGVLANEINAAGIEVDINKAYK